VPFSGFPNSAEGTAIPNVFFARVLPEISDPAELVVTLYVFFAQALHRRHPRFVTLSELQADQTLARSLGNLAGDGPDALKRGLSAAVRRGTLARAVLLPEAVRDSERAPRLRAKEGEEVYVVNAPVNRKALEPLLNRGGHIDRPPPGGQSKPAGIFVLYEENLGMITPLIADELLEAEKRYPPAWIAAAFREAAELNKRNWRYIRRILERWENEGPPNEKPERDPEAEWLARRYREGKQRTNGRP
jgi:DnaD/phage-associated family protein